MKGRHSAALNAVLVCLPIALSACSEEAVTGAGPWRVERATQHLPQEPQSSSLELARRLSFDDVTRPFAWSWDAFDLRGTVGASLEFEVATRAHLATAPHSVTADLGGRRLTVEPVPEPNSGPRPWYRYRALLPPDLSGTNALVVTLDGERWPPSGGFQGWQQREERWLVSLPRVFQRRDTTSRYNIVLITVDTLRADHLGMYGYDRATSPKLDAWAEKSVVFERALSQAAWTLPSYASMFTALYPMSHGVVHRFHRLEGKFVALAEVFAGAGYTTGAFVSGTFTDAEWGFDQGFDSYDDLGMVTSDNAPSPVDPVSDAAMKAAETRITSPEITDKSIAWLKENRDRRFLLLAHYFDPHEDLVFHEGFSNRFPPRPIQQRMRLSATPVPEEVAQQKAWYEGEIAFTDHHIGRLLAFIRESGLEESTIVVLSSDHGEEYYERLHHGHGHSLFNELLHVPLVLRVPGREPARIAAKVANVDLFPTLCELNGIEQSFFSVGGESLVQLMDEPQAERSAPIFTARYPGTAPPNALRANKDWIRVDQGDRVYIGKRQDGRTIEWLFEGDVEQRKSLSSERPDETKRMRALFFQSQPKMLEIRASIGPPGDGVDINSLTESLRKLGYIDDGDEMDVQIPASDSEGGETPEAEAENSRMESTFFRYESSIGDKLRARPPNSQETEALLACNVLNRMTSLGKPNSFAMGACCSITVTPRTFSTRVDAATTRIQQCPGETGLRHFAIA